MIDPNHLVTYVISPTLKILDLPPDQKDSFKAATQLLLGTAMQESECGTWLHQISGPAVGVWQMEPATAYDLFRWINGRPELVTVMHAFALDTQMNTPEEMAGNLYLACAMARIYYYRIPEPLPPADDIPAQAAYYKRYYNTPAGAATVAQYMQGWDLVTRQLKA